MCNSLFFSFYCQLNAHYVRLKMPTCTIKLSPLSKKKNMAVSSPVNLANLGPYSLKAKKDDFDAA